MGALYGILGDAGSEEIRAIGERLVHRGNRVCEWSVGPLLRFGMRSSAGALERLTGGAITYDGIIDNRDELTEEHHRGFSPLDDAATVLELFHRDGIEAFARIAGQFEPGRHSGDPVDQVGDAGYHLPRRNLPRGAGYVG